MAKNEGPVHAELERRSNDIIKVFNPTDVRRVIRWDSGSHAPKVFPVEAQGEALLPRYIAEKYIKESVQREITQQAHEGIEKENKRRMKTGQALLDKREHGDQLNFESKYYNTTQEAWLKIASKYFGGLVTSFGLDVQEEPVKHVDSEPEKPVHVSGMDALFKGIAPSKVRETVISSEEAKKKAVKKISKSK